MLQQACQEVVQNKRVNVVVAIVINSLASIDVISIIEQFLIESSNNNQQKQLSRQSITTIAKRYRIENIKYFDSSAINAKDDITLDIYVFINCIKEIVNLKSACLVQLNI